ncbi:MAG TPA: LEPR-XLL domain-containing protein, partial [Rubrivivax sp.]|nr:LEPR-XLL domain-containing protein [Rubrivivax sp.]
MISRVLNKAFGGVGNWLSKPPKAKRTRRGAGRKPYLLEQMEPRLLLSGSAGVDAQGLLTVRGDAGVNDIRIEQVAQSADATSATFRITLDGVLLTDFSGVKVLDVDALGGNDTVRLLSDVTVAATVVGGAGNDTFFGPDVDTAWTVSGAGQGSAAGASFSGFEGLVGGSKADSFTVQVGAALSGGIAGGDGADGIVASETQAHSWFINGLDAGTLDNILAFESIENLLGGKRDDSFLLAASGSISGAIDGGLDDAQGTAGVDTLSFAGRTSAVAVSLGGELPSATNVAAFQGIEVLMGSSAADTLTGPDEGHITWTVSGANSGDVGGVKFISFESLVGASLTANDLFVFDAAGSLSGSVAGGSGTYDSISVQAGVGGDYSVFNPAGLDAAGTLTLHGKTIVYSGIDRQDLTGGTAENKIIYGSVFKDRMVIEAADAGRMSVSFVGLNFFDGFLFSKGVVFDNPSDSLSVYGLSGADHIEIRSLGTLFSADLRVYGSRMPLLGSLAQVPEDDGFVDSVVISGNINTRGGFLDIWADNITVNSGVVVETDGGDIVLRARMTGLADIENLLPVLGTARSVNIDIGTGATLRGGGIYLIAQAEDQSTAAAAGVPTEVDNFIISPLQGILADALALPVKLLVKNSTATITLRENVQIEGSSTVGIYATAAADASGVAQGSLFSVGYTRAVADARIDIKTGVRITSGAAVVITSSADATATMNASTEREMDSTQNPGAAQIALALAVSDANATSLVTVATGTRIEAQLTANITAKGGTTSEAEAATGLFADGKAGLAFGFNFSKADIRTSVDGTVIARADPVLGYTVKIEIDPLETDPTKPGYVDYANSRIFVGVNALVTEDVITYTNRRGTSIGGLVDGRSYFVITAGDGWIKLAETETQALRAAALVEDLNIVKLTRAGVPATENNT